MAGELTGRRIAILVNDGFEQVEMTGPMEALKEAGANVEVVSPQREKVRGWTKGDWGDRFPVDRLLSDASVEDYDALVLPGGVINADRIRVIPEARDLVRAFLEEDKPIAAICHAPWLLIDADVVVGRRMTSWPTLEKDLENAGADWVNEEVVVDRGVVTSRKPDDIPVFNREMINLFARQDVPPREIGKQRGQGPSPSSTR
jgi:protease I